MQITDVNFVLNGNLLQSLMNYLSQRPWIEVSELMSALLACKAEQQAQEVKVNDH